jgi:hypothetical protein
MRRGLIAAAVGLTLLFLIWQVFGDTARDRAANVIALMFVIGLLRRRFVNAER